LYILLIVFNLLLSEDIMYINLINIFWKIKKKPRKY